MVMTYMAIYLITENVKRPKIYVFDLLTYLNTKVHTVFCEERIQSNVGIFFVFVGIEVAEKSV